MFGQALLPLLSAQSLSHSSHCKSSIIVVGIIVSIIMLVIIVISAVTIAAIINFIIMIRTV